MPGCILHVPSYRRQPLKIMRDGCLHNDSGRDVTVRVKKLNRDDKRELFGEHIGKIKDSKFKVLYLFINNFSDKDYIFTPDCVELKQVSCRDVVKSMKKTNSIGRLSLYAAFSINPLAFMSSQNPAVIPVAICVVPFFAVMSCIGFAQGVKSVVMNKRVRQDLEEKIAHEKITIHSGGHYEGLIFVKSADYKPQFSVTLHEKDNTKNSIIFDVDARHNTSHA
jgi:hypothetical protein